MTLDPTATHLPVWEKLFSEHEIKTVLEFGCGLFSTNLFSEKGCDVTSIEMQHKEWYDRVKAELPEVNLILALGPFAWQELDLLPKYDAIFVDGHGDSRPDCMMWAKDRTNIIVAHDTEHDYYKWERADMSGFDVFLFDEHTPTTTVWVKKTT